MNLKDLFEDMLPIKRKTSADWVVPALAGLGIGVAAGIGVGLLLAPEPGDEMRFRLRRGAQRMKEKAGDLAQRARGQIASTAERVQERSS